ncbi:UNVERIFIED_CONTAM: hypothetical protein Sradi_3134800 [Sesamum radiatum]|uniref:Uncharacterized protein n=1 Tax=Sesamum radiatum TaxID=300843 RepID=A0AAW2REP8_SESRA
MASFDNEGDNNPFRETLPYLLQLIQPSTSTTSRRSASDPVFDPAAIPTTLNLLLAKQVRFIMEIVQVALPKFPS